MDWHLPDIRTAGGEVVALADVVPGRAARFAAERDVPHAFDDYRGLLALDTVDIVAICTPPHVHEEIAVAALEAGKHVYLEKPPAMNADEMARIVEVARRSQGTLMSGSNNIYHPDAQALKRRLDAGELGTVYAIEALKRLRHNITRGWHRQKAIAGGGVGMDSTAHRIDLMLYLLDMPEVEWVTAQTFDYFKAAPPNDGGYMVMDVAEGLSEGVPVADVEDMLMAFVQFKDGPTCILRDARAANLPEDLRVDSYGTRQGVTMRPFALYGRDDDGLSYEKRPALPEREGGAHVPAYRHLFDCIRRGCETQSPGERSVAVMRILDAIYASAAQGGRQVWFD
jgi:predicted dehydrogenase